MTSLTSLEAPLVRPNKLLPCAICMLDRRACLLASCGSRSSSREGIGESGSTSETLCLLFGLDALGGDTPFD